MIQNYLKIALRNLNKHRFYSLINVAGLAMGITCFIFILLYVQDELSYDKYHDASERTYRLDMDVKLGDTEMQVPEVGAPVGNVLQETFPEVETFTRIRVYGPTVMRFEDQTYKEPDMYFVDSTLFDVFSFEMLEGDAHVALARPNSVVITPEIARKYFGDANPIGKILTSSRDEEYEVTGLFAGIPANTHFQTDMLYSLSTLDESRQPQWTNMNFHTYIVLREDAKVTAVIEKLPEIVRTYIGSEVEQFLGVTYDELLASGNYADMSLFPLEDIHLRSGKYDELQPGGDIKYVYIFSCIGIFILLIACINFMNLATARSANRAKEVGIRKVVGAVRNQLVKQFLSESVLIALISLLIGAVAVQVLLPYFNELAGKTLTLKVINTPQFWGIMLGITLFVGLLAGSYPALFLSGFRPIQVLKGSLAKGVKSSGLRNGLVVFQFAITTILIAGTFIIFNQLDYIQNKKLGYNKDQVLLLDNAYMLGNRLDALKNRMLQEPAVARVSVTSYLPTPSGRNNTTYALGKQMTDKEQHVVQNWYVDDEFVETLDIQLLAGRDFEQAFGTDSLNVVINKTAANMLGVDPKLENQFVSRYEGDGSTYQTYQVIGIVEDFHFASLRDEIGPLVLHKSSGDGRFMAIHVNTSDVQNVIATLQSQWESMAPGQPFEYTFMDDTYNAMYKAENRIGKIFGTFAFLAIFIACIGMLGLATFTAEQRTKEIGIRKVLGATVPDLFLLLTKDFGKLILIALVLAVPITWYAMNRWLQDFAYATSINWLTFVVAGIVIVIIAALTISYQSLKAATINPVDTLKHE